MNTKRNGDLKWR